MCLRAVGQPGQQQYPHNPYLPSSTSAVAAVAVGITMCRYYLRDLARVNNKENTAFGMSTEFGI